MMIDFWASFAPVFLESVMELFVEPYFTQTKVPQDFWILVILPQFSLKTFKQKEKKFCKMFGICRHPPPPLGFNLTHSSKISKDKQHQ